jgi:Na+-translocating ferredoxin:NAD+ oxidoreductase RnfG subunit
MRRQASEEADGMNKDSTLYKVILLGVLCGICGLLLAATNALTAPKIAEAAIAKEKANLELIYPGATFTEMENKDDTGLITGVYQAEGKGYIYKVETVGYNPAGFSFLIAFNNDGTVGGFVPIQQSESPGFGARAFEADYTSKITSLTSQDAFPLLSGATYTSTAIVNGINAAKALFNEQMGISYDATATAAPAETKGVALSLADDYSENKVECTESSNDGKTAVYACTARGFGLIDPDGIASETGHEYKRNEAEITVDLSTMSITSYKLTVFGDTEGVGDKAVTDDNLAKYSGATLESSIDATSGATYTSKSLAAMAQAALNAAAGK